MIRRWLVLIALVSAAAPAAARSQIADSWIRVQEALAAGDLEAADQRITELVETGRDFGVERMTPYAAALAMWAASHSGSAADRIVVRVQELDPKLPTSYFLRSERRWQQRQYIDAVKWYSAGWWAVARYGPARGALLASLGGWFVLALAWSVVVAVVLQILRFLRRMAHDAVELGGLAFRRPNAIVVAIVILLLPLFAGLGPVWLVAYLFALSWAYMTPWQQVTGVVSCCILALVGPALGAWMVLAHRGGTVISRVEGMLDDRQLDPSTVQELVGLESKLEGISAFHLVYGELIRMHGDADTSRLQFQKAALLDDRDPRPLIFLGNLSMEDGDVPRAIQQFNAAIEVAPRAALAYHNLSSAYDQSRRFQEGDAARATARSIAGRGIESLGVHGRDPRILYPRLGAADVARIAAEGRPWLDDDERSPSFQRDPLAELIAPSARVFFITAVFGIVVMLIRRRWMWIAQSCTKCGKIFCPRCKTATESSSYCSQCISVFLKRDVVSIEQQAAKLDQIRRWSFWSAAGQRIAGLVAPGSHHVLEEHVWWGVVYGFFGWLLLTGAVVWSQLYLPTVDPVMSISPIQIVFSAGFSALWLRTVVVAWSRR